MPWHVGPPDKSSPSRWQARPYATAYGFDDGDMSYAKENRAALARDKETMDKYQKQFGRDDREMARFFGEQASELLKEYRGWDLAIRWLNGEEAVYCWRSPAVSDKIAPYLDRALDFIIFRETKLQSNFLQICPVVSFN